MVLVVAAHAAEKQWTGQMGLSIVSRGNVHEGRHAEFLFARVARDICTEHAIPANLFAMPRQTSRKGKSGGEARKRRKQKESRLSPLLRRMTDPLKQYEIIPNGNPRFLTKASQKAILEVRIFAACSWGSYVLPNTP